MPFRWCSNKYMCFFCCSSFVDSSKLKQHTSEEHFDAKLENVLRNIKDLGNTGIKLDVSEVCCKRCLATVTSLQEFLDHIVQVHGEAYDEELLQCLFAFKLSDEGMSCENCGKSFRFFGTLLSHIHKCHSRPKPFLCEVCGEGFICKSTLISHLKSEHSGNQRQCKKCKRIFPSQYALSTHYSKTHRPRNLKCPQCSEVLGSSYLKKRHLALVHDFKDTQFGCIQCDKMFMRKSALLQHVSRVHLKEKSFTCDICGFKVFSRDLLKRHMVKHDDSRPFRCEYCKKCFQRKKTLEFHTRIHTNDRRYVCKDCGKSFVQVTSLKLHTKVHHSVRIGVMVDK